MDRLPELTAEDMNDAQRRILADIQSSRGGIRGPFPWLLRSPGMANIAQQLGAYLRYDSPLPGNLRELAILVVARFWAAQYEWHAPAPRLQNKKLLMHRVHGAKHRQPGYERMPPIPVVSLQERKDSWLHSGPAKAI